MLCRTSWTTARYSLRPSNNNWPLSPPLHLFFLLPTLHTRGGSGAVCEGPALLWGAMSESVQRHERGGEVAAQRRLVSSDACRIPTGAAGAGAGPPQQLSHMPCVEVWCALSLCLSLSILYEFGRCGRVECGWRGLGQGWDRGSCCGRCRRVERVGAGLRGAAREEEGQRGMNFR